MIDRILRGLVAGTLAALAPLAGAHEFTCSATASLLAVTPAGNVAVNGDGLPVSIGGSILPTLTVRSYPAVIGVQVALRNVASEPSVMTGMWDTLDSTGGAPALRFGPFFGEGVTIPVGGTLVGWFAYEVTTQEECLHAFGGRVDAPVCTNDATDFRFVATHDVGSTECRARIVCAAQPAALGPPPAPACPPTWHGVKQFGSPQDDAGPAIALDPQCNVDVAGFWNSPGREGSSHGTTFLAQLLPDGSVGQILPWRGDPTAYGTYATGVAVDLDGNRFLGWNGLAGHVTKFGPSGGWTGGALYVVEGVAVDVAGNAYAVGADPAQQAVVAKFAAADGQLVWERAIPGSSLGLAIALDASGNILATGTGVNAYAVKLDSTGKILWMRFVQTDRQTGASSIAADSAGDAYVVGSTTGAPAVNAGAPGAFVARIDTAGDLAWVRQFGGDNDRLNGVAADGAGNVWAAGANPWDGTAFVAKLDPAGNLLFRTPFEAPTGPVYPEAITLDAAGNAFVTGRALGTGAGGLDVFVAKFDPLGNLQ